jgi:hypothetical protein
MAKQFNIITQQSSYNKYIAYCLFFNSKTIISHNFILFTSQHFYLFSIQLYQKHKCTPPENFRNVFWFSLQI